MPLPFYALKKLNILLVGGCGYIGSYLYQRFLEEHCTLTVCDRLSRGNPLQCTVIQDDYANLTQDFLAQFDAVLWFAGHSSVGQSLADPQGAIENNCLNLFKFARLLSPKTKFIYASTGSLYSSKDIKLTCIASEKDLTQIPYQNSYDISKFTFDYLAENFLQNFYGLRMGTLSGCSPNLRQELVFNAMNISAKSTGIVHVKNPHAQRTILMLDDLWIFICHLLLGDHASGFYNVGTHSCSVGELAEIVAGTWGAKINHEGDSPTYSFILNTELMRTICQHDLKQISVVDYCHAFMRDYEKTFSSAPTFLA